VVACRQQEHRDLNADILDRRHDTLPVDAACLPVPFQQEAGH
jgi:hypothetical protein